MGRLSDDPIDLQAGRTLLQIPQLTAAPRCPKLTRTSKRAHAGAGWRSGYGTRERMVRKRYS